MTNNIEDKVDELHALLLDELLEKFKTGEVDQAAIKQAIDAIKVARKPGPKGRGATQAESDDLTPLPFDEC